jgi:hypothetical protein
MKSSFLNSQADPAGPIWYTTSQNLGRRSTATKKLAIHQNHALRIVTGAYKATRICQLETEAFIPPVDIWLEARKAYFHRRLERAGMAQLILTLSAPIKRQVLNRHRRSISHRIDDNQMPLERRG